MERVLLLYFLNFCATITVTDSSLFNLGYTDQISDTSSEIMLRHTCLYAAASVKPKNKAHQIISYCLSEWPSKWNITMNNRNQRFTFAELQERNISSEQLYLWSVPVDLIERYQLFLNSLATSDNITIATELFFYNCSLPWFGPMCEYTFAQDEYDHMSFGEIVYKFYIGRVELTTLTCYEHLRCHRGPASSCLDWSEICDGHIDCLDGGRDEERCWQLEINVCQDNQYRCLNGQCIDETLVRDDEFSPDCLDGSDEEFVPLRRELCSVAEPTFICEDTTCVPRTALHTVLSTSSCLLEREKLMMKEMFLIEQNSTLNMCWPALVCVANLRLDPEDLSCINFCQRQRCQQLIEGHCPPFIYLPAVPVVFGHVYFVYTNNQSTFHSRYAREPAYVCYNEHFCPELPTTITLVEFNNVTCRRYIEVPTIYSSTYRPGTWSRIVEQMRQVFGACRSMINNSSVLCNMSIMYRCDKTAKCISMYRINDGVRDCFFGDDEKQLMTTEQITSRNRSKNWYKCENANMSISAHLVGHLVIKVVPCQCPITCDDQVFDEERFIRRHISFQTLCDGYTELNPPILIDERNETDETECEQWLCNNTYTRCNGIWNCLNGADELGCSNPLPLLSCTSNQHICVSPWTYKFMCLPISKAHDGIPDCLGGTDEPQLCQTLYHSSKAMNRPIFYCTTKNRPLNCTTIEDLCSRGPSDCVNGDNQHFCTSNRSLMEYNAFCHDENEKIRSDVENFFCRSLRFSKSRIVHFSLGGVDKSIKRLDTAPAKTSSIQSRSRTIFSQSQRCHLGLNMKVRLDMEKNVTIDTCLCPPSYYGDLCQYQNQRVSLTLKLRALSDSWSTPFAVVVSLIDDDERLTKLHEQFQQFTYLSIRDCESKFHLSLLYATRPKNETKNYSIHIDIYEKQSLTHRASWLIPVLFSFLPVHRISTQLTIVSRLEGIKICSDPQCEHGRCTQYVGDATNVTFCQCNKGWSGRYCTIPYNCTCSNDSKCIGTMTNNRSLCVCSLKKFGARCLLDQPACRNDPCQNGGTCVPIDEHIPSKNRFTCICLESFTGDKCEEPNTEIIISFEKDINLPQAMLAHLIQEIDKRDPKRTTKYKNIAINRNSVTIYSSHLFQVLVVEFLKHNYYLAVIQKIFNRSTTIVTTVNSSHRCPHIRELFNETFAKSHMLRRIKSYHLPCQKRSSQLSCFFDEKHLCFCTDDGNQRLANCLEFDHNMPVDCSGQSICLNSIGCYYDNPNCPQASICHCLECFYGRLCEFSTNGFGLSLDAILGYHIQPHTDLRRQSSIFQVSTTITMIMFMIGLTNGVLCTMTFQVRKLREIGCGLYLFSLSITSLLTWTIFAVKFWLLVLSQMGLIMNRSFLHFQCHSIDFLLRSCLNMDQWLATCVAIERAITVLKGASFDKKRSKQIARWVIGMVLILAISTVIQDPIHRKLIDDNNGDEKRIWCIIQYSPQLEVFNSAVHIFHVAVPSLINLISALIVIVTIARQRETVHTHQTYRKHLREQFQEHKHLLIAPGVLIILVIPRFVLAFTSGCMKSPRNPWLFLIGYFISFIPSLSTFVVFVLPSQLYKNEFMKSVARYRNIFKQCMDRNA